ncbi:TrbI/VirB10 family protein (plasmid) [Pseudoduganella sp. UC29_106]|uniref:TrbI/VirB10 family protein n=1 Tax=Pseudoduganella sp. UC29_106 TaxID=3374553 RepID=UPI0037566F63
MNALPLPESIWRNSRQLVLYRSRLDRLRLCEITAIKMRTVHSVKLPPTENNVTQAAQARAQAKKSCLRARLFSAVLDMDMVSDYAGNWWALLQRPVYDPSMTFVLFPAGTKIVGKSMRATGANENIQNRMGSVPLWAIRPDGKRIDFKRTAGMDAAGVAALKDQVDRHFLAQFMGVAAYAIIGLGPSFSNYGAEPNSSRDAFAREFTSRSRDAGRSFAEKFLNIVPTVRIRAGTPVKIFVEEDIYVTPWEKIDESHYTRRQ